jgi:hypothetical protein
MKVTVAKSVAELKSLIDQAGSGVLFRGQTIHYGGLESPAMTTSFERKGCVPSEMVKWSFYARGALKYALGEVFNATELLQAVLQHYGWRSFYLDLSSSPHVGAWFAANTFVSKIAIEMCEDCFESPIWLRKQMARYELQPGTGHLYLVDKVATASLKIGLHDLSVLNVPSARPRFAAQSAWLAGPQWGNLPIECFNSRIIADRQIFADFAAEAGIVVTDDVFPSSAEDPVLAALLDLPWLEIVTGKKGEQGLDIAAFRRCLELPEYQDSFIKIHPPHHAFYRGEMVTDEIEKNDKAEVPFTIRAIPEMIVFGHADPLLSIFPKLNALVEEESYLAFEIRNLVRLSETGPTPSYGKGLAVQKKADGTVEVSEFAVEHPGMAIAGGGINSGWHYAIDDKGEWSRIEHEEDCPCNNPDRHQRHFASLTILEHWLSDPTIFDPV